MGAVLIQFGTWHLHGFPEQRFELVQNRNGLTVDAVQMERGHANGRLIFKWAKEHGRTQEPLDFLCNRIGFFGIKVVEKSHEHRPRRAEHTTLTARVFHQTGGTFCQNAVARIKAKAGIDLSDIVDFDGDQTSLARHATHFANGVDQGVNIAKPVTESVVSAKLRLMIMPTYMPGSVSVPSKR